MYNYSEYVDDEASLALLQCNWGLVECDARACTELASQQILSPSRSLGYDAAMCYIFEVREGVFACALTSFPPLDA